jgi:2-keto-4-pentenoate hydratase/2-oxohepta-3-ene-1,7-dioic acid hydratase in catechol pathway
MTLYPGDIFMSGAADVGPVLPGETMTIEIPRIGKDVGSRASVRSTRVANPGVA